MYKNIHESEFECIEFYFFCDFKRKINVEFSIFVCSTIRSCHYQTQLFGFGALKKFR